jgi:hypothetical protein
MLWESSFLFRVWTRSTKATVYHVLSISWTPMHPQHQRRGPQSPHKCEAGRAKNQVFQVSNSAEALTLEGQQVYIQLPNSLQAKDLEATDPTLRWIIHVEGRRTSSLHQFPGSLTTDPGSGPAVSPPPSSSSVGLHLYPPPGLVPPLHQSRAGGLYEHAKGPSSL